MLKEDFCLYGLEWKGEGKAEESDIYKKQGFLLAKIWFFHRLSLIMYDGSFSLYRMFALSG